MAYWTEYLLGFRTQSSVFLSVTMLLIWHHFLVFLNSQSLLSNAKLNSDLSVSKDIQVVSPLISRIKGVETPG